MLCCVQSEASGGVPGSEGEHPSPQSWLCLQARVHQVHQEVSKRGRNGDSRKIGVGDGRGYGMARGETENNGGGGVRGGLLVNFGNWELFMSPSFSSFYVFFSFFFFPPFFVYSYLMQLTRR